MSATLKKIKTPALSAADTKFALARRVLAHVREQLEHVERLLSEDVLSNEFERMERLRLEMGDETHSFLSDGRMIEGVFDGERMVGEDGEPYAVPPNYASKSKLVEGDLMRLTIHANGKFIFKQKGPIERQRLIGMLICDEQTGEWKVAAGGNKYRILPAAISYFKGQAGDEAVILVPQNTPSRWAALENVIRRGAENG